MTQSTFALLAVDALLCGPFVAAGAGHRGHSPRRPLGLLPNGGRGSRLQGSAALNVRSVAPATAKATGRQATRIQRVRQRGGLRAQIKHSG